MSDTTVIILSIAISTLSIIITIVNVILIRATKRRTDAIARGEIFGVDFH